VICDAHVHMGYYPRLDRGDLWYYSPRRIYGVLKRCDIGEFIVSSTCAQLDGVGLDAILREAAEMRRVAGRAAHVFFWLSGRLYDADKDMRWLESGLFSGVKLHEGETPWMSKRPKDLRRILGRADAWGLPVQMHAGPCSAATPKRLSAIAKMFPRVRFDFAHCRPMAEMACVMAECENVWTDTAYMPPESFGELKRHNWHDRLMFGTDLPVWQARSNCALTSYCRLYRDRFRESVSELSSEKAFRSFVS